jgi:hypothetical protein
MIYRMRKILALIAALFLLGAPYLLSPSLAQAEGCATVDRSLTAYGATIPSLPKYCSVGEITRKVLNVAFTLIGGVSLLFVIIGGYRYMTAGGSEEQVAAGKKTAIYAIVGLVVVVLAVSIVNIVVNLVLYGRTV